METDGCGGCWGRGGERATDEDGGGGRQGARARASATERDLTRMAQTRVNTCKRVLSSDLPRLAMLDQEHSSVSGVKASGRRDTEDASRRANGRVAFWFTRARRARESRQSCTLSDVDEHRQTP